MSLGYLRALNEPYPPPWRLRGLGVVETDEGWGNPIAIIDIYKSGSSLPVQGGSYGSVATVATPIGTATPLPAPAPKGSSTGSWLTLGLILAAVATMVKFK